jgi:hypothetical protein
MHKINGQNDIQYNGITLKRHIYILKENFGLTEIQPPKYSSQIWRFCLYISVTYSISDLNPKLCVVIIYCVESLYRAAEISAAQFWCFLYIYY